MMPDLKPCPFCKARPVKLNNMIHEHPRDTGCVLDGFAIRTMSPEHVLAWNTRAKAEED